MQIEIDVDVIEKCNEIYETYMQPDYLECQDYYDKHMDYYLEELGEWLFYRVIGKDKERQIFDHHNPPEPEPDPLPVPENDNEIVIYCRQCEKPTIYRTDPDDPDNFAITYCAICNRKRIAVMPVKKETDK